jgi:hypothetical protein
MCRLLFPMKSSSLRKLPCSSGKVIKYHLSKTSHLSKLDALLILQARIREVTGLFEHHFTVNCKQQLSMATRSFLDLPT